MGRWTSRDPIGFGGGLNQYGYVGANPVMFVDPKGLDRYTYNKDTGKLYYYEDGNPYLPVNNWDVNSGPYDEGALPDGKYDMEAPVNNVTQPAYCDVMGNCWFIPFSPVSEMPLGDDGYPRCTATWNGGTGRCGFHADGNSDGTAGCIAFDYADTSTIRDFIIENPAPLFVVGGD